MKPILCLLCLIFCEWVFAQDTFLPELPELNGLNLETEEFIHSFLEPFSVRDTLSKSGTYSVTDDTTVRRKLLFTGRTNSRWNPDEKQLILRQMLKYYDGARLDYRIITAEGEQPQFLPSGYIVTSEHRNGNYATLVIGNYFVNAGEGLILGSSSLSRFDFHNIARNSIPKTIFPVSIPTRYSFTGAALEIVTDHSISIPGLRQKTNVLSMWLSSQQRQATMTDDEISYLYTNRKDTADRETVLERGAGFVLKSSTQSRMYGLAASWQDYNKPFASTDDKPAVVNATLFGNYIIDHSSLKGEVAFSNDKPALSLGFIRDKWYTYQYYNYIRRPDVRPLPYSHTGQVLGQKTGMEELNYSLKQRLGKGFSLTNRIAVSKKLNSNSFNDWKDREIFILDYHRKSDDFSLSYHRFRKNVITDEDSLYRDWLAVQNRIAFTYEYKLSKASTLFTRSQYQHYTGAGVFKNGFIQETGYRINAQDLHLTGKIRMWSNLKDSYQESMSGEDTEYLSVSGSDAAMGINIGYTFSKRLSVSCSGYRPLNNPGHETYYLSWTMGNR